MKFIASIKKSEQVRFISHLDVQRDLQRTVRRANIPVAYSQGFNPHPLISFATALSVGQTGNCEWIEIKLAEDMPLKSFVEGMNLNFPTGLMITQAYKAADGVPSVATLMKAAVYTAYTDEPIDKELLESAVTEMLSGEIVVTKAKKQGGKKIDNAEVDLRPMLYEFNAENSSDNKISVHIRSRLDASGGLNADKLLSALNEKLGKDIHWIICRERVEIKDFSYTDEYHI